MGIAGEHAEILLSRCSIATLWGTDLHSVEMIGPYCLPATICESLASIEVASEKETFPFLQALLPFLATEYVIIPFPVIYQHCFRHFPVLWVTCM